MRSVPPRTRALHRRSTARSPRRRSSPASRGVPTAVAQAKAATSQAAVEVPTPSERPMSGRISTGALAPAARGVASSASQNTGTGLERELGLGLGGRPGAGAGPVLVVSAVLVVLVALAVVVMVAPAPIRLKLHNLNVEIKSGGPLNVKCLNVEIS